ncbi:MAG: (d)CMP kinase [Hyphomicrobium sp.]|nr:(d)CMP kinase [Hyphomicrobium sp.]PPC81728.1 MAG: cytidylate kinase [Hyphomicrobium sp.]
MIIAIDGPAASGKGTLAKRIADHFGLHCLDTGLLYRAVARDVVRAGFRFDDTWAAVAYARGLDPATLDDPALRGAAAGDAASVVAKIPEVRRALLAYQRAFSRHPPGAVLDGRDIGTVVCPDADAKIFVTATPEIRAERRYLELKSRGDGTTFDRVLAMIRERDARDSGRADAPMKRADDAILLDTTDLDIETSFDAAVGLILRKIGQRSAPWTGTTG